MEIKDVEQIPYMIQQCGEDVSKYKELKYDLVDTKLYYADLIQSLERDERGFSLDTKLFRQYKYNINKSQRYLDQVNDIIKDLTLNQILESRRLKQERDDLKKEEGLKREQEKEKYRIEKERLKDERIKMNSEIEKSRDRLFIKISKEYLSESQWLEIFKRVDELIK